jgi:phosphatidylglycerophosphate synthase
MSRVVTDSQQLVQAASGPGEPRANTGISGIDAALRLRSVLKQLPNALSAARIAASPVLVVLAASGASTPFTWLLVAALLSDIADGLVARVLKLQSKLGALLDSIADTMLLFTSLYGMWVFHRGIVEEHWLAAGVLVGAWVIETVAALVRYGRLSSFHTYLSKAAGYLLGIFIGVTFVFGFAPGLLYLAVAVSVLGNLEELVLLALLPKWRPDVRGVWWVIGAGRQATP